MREEYETGGGLGENPEDYRNILEGFTVSAPGQLRVPGGRAPFGPGGYRPKTATIRPRAEPTALSAICDCIEERFRNFMPTAQIAPWLAPPANAIIVDRWNDTAVAVDSAQNYTILEIVVPEYHLLRISKIGQWLEVSELWGDVTWDFRINGVIPDYEGVYNQYGSFLQQIGTISDPKEIYITAKGGDTILLRAICNLANNLLDIKARLVGWLVPQKYQTDGPGATNWLTY